MRQEHRDVPPTDCPGLRRVTVEVSFDWELYFCI